MGGDSPDKTDVLVLGPEVAPTQLLALQVADRSRLETPPSTAVTNRVAADPAQLTPERAMLYDEATRLRAFSGFLAIFSAITVVMLLVLRGDPTARAMHMGAVGVAGVFAAAYWWVARDPATYRPAHALGLAHIAMLANISGFYYWGVFGPYAAIVPVSAYVFANGASLGVFWSGLVVNMTSHFALGVAIIEGWLADRGKFQPAAATGKPGSSARCC